MKPQEDGTKDRERQNISLQIEDKRFRLSVPRAHESAFRYAAEELNNTTNIYRTRFPNEDALPPGAYLTMTAIDVAYRAELMRRALDVRDLDERLAKLNEQAELILRQAESSLDALSAEQ